MSEAPIPFSPESIEQMIARYPDAVLYSQVMGGDNPFLPFTHREHVFDFDDGLRLVIFKVLVGPVDLIQFEGRILRPDIYDKDYMGRMDAELLMKFETRFRKISGESRKFHLLILSPADGSPVWLVVEKGMAFFTQTEQPDYDELIPSLPKANA